MNARTADRPPHVTWPAAPRERFEPSTWARAQLAQQLAFALGRPLSAGNSIAPVRGEQAMLEAIAHADEQVDFDGDIAGAPRQAQVLATRGERGVPLNLLRAGWLARWRRRRAMLLLIDGRVAFVGARHAPLRVEGPAVAELQRGFAYRWAEATGAELPDGANRAARLAPVGLQRIGIAGDAAAWARALRTSIDAAHERIVVARSLAKRLRSQLAAAAERGVELRPAREGDYAVIDGVCSACASAALLVLDAGFAAQVERELG